MKSRTCLLMLVVVGGCFKRETSSLSINDPEIDRDYVAQCINYGGAIDKETNEAENIPVISKKLKAFLVPKCGSCHTPEGSAKSGQNGSSDFSDILDMSGLLAAGLIDKANPIKSQIFSAIEKARMPLDGNMTDDERKQMLATLLQWIKEGAPQLKEEVKKRPIVSTETAIACMEKYARSCEFQAGSLRFLTLYHLANSGQDAKLELARVGIAKLINSLSWSQTIHNPVPIDPLATIYAVELSNLNHSQHKQFQYWDGNLWNRFFSTKNNPYWLKYDFPEFHSLKQLTAAENGGSAFVRGDWFVNEASFPETYHDLLGLPSNLKDLEHKLGVTSETFMRAGFQKSGVSKNNRIIERREIPSHLWKGAYWISYDFAEKPSDRNKKDIFAHPLDFEQDGGEVIFNLPNGLQGYFLVNNKSQRIDTPGNTQIVSDINRPRDDYLVVNGISCMGCHYAGIRRKGDELSEATLNFQVRNIYKIKADGPEFNADEQRFAEALVKLGIDKPSPYEPIFNTNSYYEDFLGQEEIAGEFALELEDLQSRLAKVDKQLIVKLKLNSGEKNTPRDEFEKNFKLLALQLGFDVNQADLDAHTPVHPPDAEEPEHGQPPVEEAPSQPPYEEPSHPGDDCSGKLGVLYETHPLYKDKSVISEVTVGCAAHNAGIRVGDVILKVRDEVNTFDLTKVVQQAPRSFSVIIGRSANQTIKLNNANTRGSYPYCPKESTLGVTYQGGQIPAEFDGGSHLLAEVLEAIPGCPAAQSGVGPGDIISRFNGRAISDKSDLGELAQQAGDFVQMEVLKVRKLVVTK